MAFHILKTLHVSQYQSILNLKSVSNHTDTKHKLNLKSLSLLTAIHQNNLIYLARKILGSRNILDEKVCGTTLLCDAVKFKRTKMIKLLLFYGADVNRCDKLHKSPLHYAALTENLAITIMLLKHYANPTLIDGDGKLPASHVSSDHSHIESFYINYLKYAETKKEDTTQHKCKEIDYFENVMVEVALRNGCIVAIQMILGRGFDINCSENFKLNAPLFTALENKNKLSRYKLIKYLIDHGADINSQNTSNKDTILCLACKENSYDLACLLVYHKAELDLQNLDNQSPLHICVNYDFYEIFQMLMRNYSIDITILFRQNALGNTLLHEAVASKSVVCVELILKVLEEQTVRKQLLFLEMLNRNDESPLRIACNSNDKQSAGLLLQIYINIYSQLDGESWRIIKEIKSNEIANIFIRLASSRNLSFQLLLQLLQTDLETMELFIDNGLQIDVLDSEEKSIFYYATDQNNLSAVNMLVQKCVNSLCKLDALNLAVTQNNVEIVTALLQKKDISNVNLLKTSLQTAFNQKLCDIVELILEQPISYDIFKNHNLEQKSIVEKHCQWAVLNIIDGGVVTEIYKNYHLEEKSAVLNLLAYELDLKVVCDFIIERYGAAEPLKFILKFYQAGYENESFFTVYESLWRKAFKQSTPGLVSILLSVEFKNQTNVLHRAVIQKYSEEYIGFLLESGVDINAVDRNENTALHIAIKQEDKLMICFLISLGADINRTDSEGRTSLHLIIKRRIILVIHKLICQNGMVLQKWINLNIQDKNGDTCLHSAVNNQDNYACKLLIKSRADVFISNEKGNTPMHLAFITDNHELVDLMLNRLKSNVLKQKFIREFMNIAIKENNCSQLKISYLERILPIHYIDFSIPDEHGEIALILAIKQNNIPIINILLDNNAKINVSDNTNLSAVEFAMKHEKKEILKTLLFSDINIQYVNFHEDTMLHLATRYYQLQLLKNLFDKENIWSILLPGDINAINSFGKTALHVAIELEHMDIALILLQYGADINIKKEDQFSALDILGKNFKLMRNIFLTVYENDSYIDETISDYECPVCYEIPEKVYTCSRKHVICHRCKEKLSVKQCPICRISLHITCERSFKHEQLISDIMKNVLCGRSS